MLAVSLRAAYLAELANAPFLLTPLYDSDVYLRQARAVRAGHFGDPSLLAFSPLYGYLLAAAGASARAVIALQLGLGLATLWLIGWLARRRSGDGAAVLAMALWTAYGVPLFFETKVLSETLGLALALAGLALFCVGAARVRAGAASAAAWSAAAGAVLALSVLARASLLFTLPLYPCVTLLQPGRPALRWGRALAMCAGIALVLGGHGLWNRAHTGVFAPVMLVSRTAAVATRAAWNGDFRVFGGGDDVSPWDVVRQAEARLRAGGSPDGDGAPLWGIDLGGLLRNAPAKLAVALGDRETTYDYGYYGERGEVPVLAALPVSFGLLEALAAIALLAILVRRGLGHAAPLLPLIAGTLATTTLFYPTTRYRLPMALALVLLAAELPALLAALAPRRRRPVQALLALLVLGFGLRTVTRRPEAPALWQLRLAEAAARSGDLREVRARVAAARALSPADAAVERRIEIVLRAAPSAR